MKKIFFLLLLLILIGTCNEALAGAASGGGSGAGGAGNAGAIFSDLAEKARRIGMGMRDAGFLIAGFGLIVFSFLAIFNKISWKMLAYIMMSTFILSSMLSIIEYAKAGKSIPDPFANAQSTGAGGDSMDPTQKEVDKTTGAEQHSSNTAPLNLQQLTLVSIAPINQGLSDEMLQKLMNVKLT